MEFFVGNYDPFKIKLSLRIRVTKNYSYPDYCLDMINKWDDITSCK